MYFKLLDRCEIPFDFRWNIFFSLRSPVSRFSYFALPIARKLRYSSPTIPSIGSSPKWWLERGGRTFVSLFFPPSDISFNTFPVVAQKFFPINPANSLKREAWNLHTTTISLINSFLRAISLVSKKYKEGTIRIIRRIIEKSRIDDGILRDLFFSRSSILLFYHLSNY